MTTTYTGRPRDIDFIKGLWTQVVLHGGPMDELISQTKNDRIVRILLLALALKVDASVEYVDEQTPRLTAATVEPWSDGKDGDVQRLSFDERDGYFRATFVQDGMPVDGWTDSEQVQSIVTTAAREGIPAGVDFDTSAPEIIRAKVNVRIEDD